MSERGLSRNFNNSVLFYALFYVLCFMYCLEDFQVVFFLLIIFYIIYHWSIFNTDNLVLITVLGVRIQRETYYPLPLDVSAPSLGEKHVHSHNVKSQKWYTRVLQCHRARVHTHAPGPQGRSTHTCSRTTGQEYIHAPGPQGNVSDTGM